MKKIMTVIEEMYGILNRGIAWVRENRNLMLMCTVVTVLLALLAVFVTAVVVPLLPLALLLTLRRYGLNEKPARFFVVGLVFLMLFQIVVPFLMTAVFFTTPSEKMVYSKENLESMGYTYFDELTLEPFRGTGENETFVLKGHYTGNSTAFQNLTLRFYRYGATYLDYDMKNAEWNISENGVSFRVEVTLEKGVYYYSVYDSAEDVEILRLGGPINTTPGEFYLWSLYANFGYIAPFNLLFFGLISFGTYLIEKKNRARIRVMRSFER